MYPPVASYILGLFILLLVVVFAFFEVGVIRVAYRRLGISNRAITALLALTIIGSYVNIPITSIPATYTMPNAGMVYSYGMPYIVPPPPIPGRTEIAINVGGALIPALVSIYLLIKTGGVIKAIIATTLVALVVHRLSRIVPGVGIVTPTVVPGMVAAGIAFLLEWRRAPNLAYVAGTMGALIGADISNLQHVAILQAPIASIGGAGTFDGIFVAGLIASLWA